MRHTWRKKFDPLYRGDTADAVQTPVPTADPSIVRHILYLDGFGRETPYLSASEVRQTAEQFAGRGGAVWRTVVPMLEGEGVAHISNTELVGLLVGSGKGKARARPTYLVLRARHLAELHAEHLVNFRPLAKKTSAEVKQTVQKVFSKV